MKNLFVLCLPFFLTASIVSAAESYNVGQRDFLFQDTARKRQINTYVWYPTSSETKMQPIIEKGRPFLPVVAAKDATLVKKPHGGFPIVLLSHGSMGEAKRVFWFASYLVKNGFMVLAVDHSGNKTGDSSADGVMRIWDRAKDLTFVLDQLLKEPHFKDQIDTTRVFAAGHSSGGATALMLGGGRFSAKQLQIPTPNCAGTKEPFFAKQCSELQALDMSKYPKDIVEANNSDSRVKAVVAFDPGFIKSFETGSLKNINALIFIADKLETPFDEAFSKEYLKLLPSKSELVPNTYHMTFLQACKPGLEKSGDPELAVLCAGNDKKIDVQNMVAHKSVVFFKKSFK